ncbi:short-chain dehydrogenase [Aureimonas endophytica]|uniref:Short-chain dehydrogenase n=1 Tax=Aureimonas endophytica TaxID=2027858 RepID=A0A917E0Y3_9HYPH|nr:SDR family oxidoreductase [Aureimonas endophytica]GGD90891.1 short-chain dehydrogenase [Aureimonas endophytica]
MGHHLIFGGNGGIGEAVAERLRASGHEVTIAGRNEPELRAVAERIGARALVCDVLKDEDLTRLAENIADGLDGLVFAVGTINLKPFEKLTEEDFLGDFRLNAVAAARSVQVMLPKLRAAKNGASVLLFSTVAVEQGFAAHASIAMAKGAVAALTRTLAAELAPEIRVNAIAPSLTDTPLGQKVAGSERMADAVAKMHPLPRLGRAADMAAMAELLLTAEGGWITGQVIGIDGGRSTLRVKG